MTVGIELQNGYSNDLLGYLASWQATFTSGTNGFFDPTYTGNAATFYNQWGAGDVYADATDAQGGNAGVLFDGSFQYTQGIFAGTVNDFVFGSGIYYDSTAGEYEFDTTGLVLDLSNADTTSSYFTYTVYILSNYGGFEDQTIRGTVRPGLYSFLAEEGTEQTGTTAADTLYSFGGNDVLTGDAGVDTFRFVLDDTGASVIGDDTITDFNIANEVIVLDLNDTAYDSFAELSIDYSTGDAVIDLGSYGSITLTSVASGLTASNFVF